MIQQVTKQDDFVVLAKLLNEAFITVAKEFGLTKENASTNSAYIVSDELKAQLIENREFYTYIDNGKNIGFVAIEKSLTTPDTFYIEKLAVLPDCRHQGIGKLLIDFASNRIAELGGKYISVSLINSNTVLKNWYSQQGYVECSIKTFEHLPFKVCFMEKKVCK
jgi:ribosomal protein S18 acetylase RimI-like enzyme